MGHTFLAVTPERIDYWTSRMAEVIDEIEAEGEQRGDGRLYAFTFVFAPLAAPLRAGQQ